MSLERASCEKRKKKNIKCEVEKNKKEKAQEKLIKWGGERKRHGPRCHCS
jgi:hypothetical protein